MEQDDVSSKLLAAEGALLELANALDEPVTPERFKVAIIALGQRSRTLYRGFLTLQASEVPMASVALMRPMAEINLLIRFLATAPDLHLDLWEAEGERNVLAIIAELPKHAHRWGSFDFDASTVAERREGVAEARSRAVEAGVAGVRKAGGPVMPGIARQLKIIGEPAADEAYTFVYRPFGWDTHTNPRTFLAGAFEERNDGTVSYSDVRDGDGRGIRAVALTTFASTLELVAHHLELSIEHDALAILREWAPEVIPDDQRLDALDSGGPAV